MLRETSRKLAGTIGKMDMTDNEYDNDEEETGIDDETIEEAIQSEMAYGYVLSVVTGEPVEPDHEESPLRIVGMI